MNCPVCDGRLRTVDKFGVEVDICPDCKGVWLDRGELEKIIDMVSNGGPSEPRREPREESRDYERRDVQSRREDDRNREEKRDEHHKDHDDREYYDPKTGKKRRRRESWFEEIFDVFGGD